MAIERKVIWETTDGTQFDDQTEALNYDQRQGFRQMLREFLTSKAHDGQFMECVVNLMDEFVFDNNGRYAKIANMFPDRFIEEDDRDPDDE